MDYTRREHARHMLDLNSSIDVGFGSTIWRYKMNQNSAFGFRHLFLFYSHHLCSPLLPSGGLHLPSPPFLVYTALAVRDHWSGGVTRWGPRRPIRGC